MTYGELRSALKARVSNEEWGRPEVIKANIDYLNIDQLKAIYEKFDELPEGTKINRIDFSEQSIDYGFTSGDGWAYIK